MIRLTAGALITAMLACLTQAQGTEELRLTVGRSVVLDYPSDVRQISTSDPNIVDALAVTTREVLLHAKAGGFATVIVWSRTGQRTIYSVVVEQNLDQLRKLLKETFPNEGIQVQGTRDSIALTGRVGSKDVADRALAIVAPFAKTVVNNLQVSALPIEKQIVLRVRFAELDRTASLSLGANIISTGAGNTVGRLTTGQFAAPAAREIGGTDSTFTITDALNIFAFRPDLNLAAFVRALQTRGVLQILAEPNLVTTNGKEASFLAGGEFPIPVLQGGGNAGAVTIQFREFGVRLNFTPVLTDNGTIKMYCKPEVSTIDRANGITLSGFFIPALSTRRVETNLELSPGQSFVIGGLLDERLTDDMSKIPGLSSVPLLGLLFKSREERKNRTELIVMVTPEITQPIPAGEPRPNIDMPRPFLGPLPTGGEKHSAAPQQILPGDLNGDKPASAAVVDKKKKS
jgi:pilus assembly protein CpaC